MRAEIQAIVEEIKQSIGLLRGILDVDKARARLVKLNRQAEDPNLWNDPQRASRLMQERTALDEQLGALSRIEQELDDQVTLIELGEAENDQKVVTEAEAALRKLKAEVTRRGSRRCWRARPTATMPMSKCMPEPAAPRARTGPTC